MIKNRSDINFIIFFLIIQLLTPSQASSLTRPSTEQEPCFASTSLSSLGKSSHLEEEPASLNNDYFLSNKKPRKKRHSKLMNESSNRNDTASLIFFSDEILFYIASYLTGKDFISFKLTTQRFYAVCQDPALTLNFDDPTEIISLLEKEPKDLIRRASRLNPQFITPKLITLAKKDKYFSHNKFNTSDERARSLLVWKRFLQIVFLAKDLGSEEAKEILKYQAADKIYTADHFAAWNPDICCDKASDLAIQACCIEQAACLDEEARRALVDSYQSGLRFTDKNDEKAGYWEKFSLQHYLWEGS